MASSLPFSFTFFCFFSFLFLVLQCQSTSNPNKFVLPLNKDSKTGLYVTHIHKRTPLMQIPLVVDLNGKFVWVTCDQNYLSSTYRAPLCHSTQCARANSHHCTTCPSDARPGCHNNACGLMSTNPMTQQTVMGELAEDVLAVQSTQGSNLGPMVAMPQFLFACAPSSLLQKGFPRDVQGVVGLGHGPISMPTQLSSHFGFSRTFSMCLADQGVIFFGNGPYYMLPGVDVSHPLGYTPLKVTSKGEYIIEIKSIMINNKHDLMNGATAKAKISTTTPYTVLDHSIFKTFTQSFNRELGIAKVNLVHPFEFCYESRKLKDTMLGPGVPNINFILQNGAVWKTSGVNSMVEPKPGVACLAFIDGGMLQSSSRGDGASVIIGSHQLENHLVQFDLGKSRLGFSSSLLNYKTTCNHFNFTTTA